MQTEFEGSNDSFLRMYYIGISGPVVINACRMADVLLVRKLLRGSDHAPVHLSKNGFKTSSCANFGSIIVCRGGQEQAAVALLKSTHAQRFMVLSDQLNEESIVRMLGNGAHHYFNISESEVVLAARLQAALHKHNFSQILSYGDICFDLQSNTVTHKGIPVSLRPKEYELAKYLFMHMGRVISRDEILDAVWALPRTVYSRRIDTTLCRIRERLKLSPKSGVDLQLVRPKGYRLVRCRSKSGNEYPSDQVFA